MRKPRPRDLVPDPRAAATAGAVALVVLIALLVLQSAVAAAFTSGSQPMAAVDTVPQDPTAAAWEQAPSRTVDLKKQQMAPPFGGGSTDQVTVKAVTNESHVAFRLSWHDPTNDTSIGAPGNYSDAAAIMFHSGTMPPITMGAVGTPVNIWYWRSSWQFGEKTSPWSGDMYAYPHPDNETKPGRAAGNPLSKDSYDQYAQNYYAKGYGSLSMAPNQPVTASAVRSGDRWKVTFVREFGTDGTHDATFDPSKPMYLAFATWNGSADEVNGQKSISAKFTKLDLTNVSLLAADSESSGDGATAGGSSGSTPGGSGSLPDSMSGWLVALVAATASTWVVAYRRVR